MRCPNISYCDGYPERCSVCSNQPQEESKHTVNNININVSGGVVSTCVALITGCIIITTMESYGTGKIHNPAGAILPNRCAIYDPEEMG